MPGRPRSASQKTGATTPSEAFSARLSSAARATPDRSSECGSRPTMRLTARAACRERAVEPVGHSADMVAKRFLRKKRGGDDGFGDPAVGQLAQTSDGGGKAAGSRATSRRGAPHARQAAAAACSAAFSRASSHAIKPPDPFDRMADAWARISRIADEALDHQGESGGGEEHVRASPGSASARIRSRSRWRARCAASSSSVSSTVASKAKRAALHSEALQEMAAEGIVGEAAVNIGAHDPAVARLRPVGRIADHGEGPCAIRPLGRAEMDLVARHRRRRSRHGAPRRASESCRHERRLDIEQAEAGRRAGRALRAPAGHGSSCPASGSRRRGQAPRRRGGDGRRYRCPSPRRGRPRDRRSSIWSRE